jgi:pimeloyl-ACP methyl ester carboxylesterase
MQTFLIHSSGLSGRQWHHLMKALPGPCHTPDLSGYPNGPAWNGGPAWSVDLTYLLGLIDQTEGPIDLVGHSYGGALVFSLALERPARIRRIVVHDPVLWGSVLSDGDEALRQEMLAFADSKLLAPEHGGDLAWMKLFIEFWGGEGAWDAMSERHQGAFLAVGPKVAREVYDLGVDRSPASAFDAIEAPTMIAMGAESPAIEREVCRVLGARGQNRTLVSIPGGHMSPVSSPRPFIEATVAFLTAP